MGKELLKLDTAPRRIKNIKFGVLQPFEIDELSEVDVVNRELYSIAERAPVRNGVLDRRLGTSDKNSTCDTCGGKLADCAGHFGNIKLALPVFHIGFFKAALQILQCICKGCSAILLSEEERTVFARRIRAPKLDSLQRMAIVKMIHKACRKMTVCSLCQATNGAVKKVGIMKIVHEKYKSATRKVNREDEAFRSLFADAIAENAEMRHHVGKAQEDINPLVALELFNRITLEDCELLGLDGECGHPRNFLWSHIPVPPSCIRPSVAMSVENGSNEDDLTVKLTEVVYTNLIIKDAMEKGVPVHMLVEDWDFLQLQCAMYINSELPGVANALQVTGKPIRGLCQRLKGKMGRFRGNLSGKRVDFSSRTVISPDPNLAINEIAVPVYVAKTLTYPETVTRFNIDVLREAVFNGPDVHPGANFIMSKDGAMKRYLKFGDRKRISRDMRVGDVVERHLRDGDVVLFNRQPSLHKLSIMAHFAVVKPWRTFRLNECACSPYNADFDGDEMNLHLPQTEEARAEAIHLMGLKHNLVTPRNGQPLIAAIQDFITASHLITNKDVFYDRADFSQCVTMMCDAAIHIDLPPPAIVKPAVRWTGKQVINVLLRPTKACAVFVNVELKTRTFTKASGESPSSAAAELCPTDGYMVVRNSELLCGTLDKSSVGSDSKSSIFYVLMRDYGVDYTITCMGRLSKLCARWLGARGFSIGINDVQAGGELVKRKEELVREGYEECNRNIAKFSSGKLESQPGCTVEETLEAIISGILSRIRDDVGQSCLQELSRYNAPLIMQWCGSKGSKINVSQMVACVGQQIISGSRIPDGFEGRSLPHFGKNEKTPPAKGFVKNSFYSGLSPTEFFFHAVSGREGLVDTAVKTAETGYMQRRLMKALEDLSTHYDMSVRSSTGGIVQFKYGDDGLDPTCMEDTAVSGMPVNFARNLLHARALYPLSSPEEGGGHGRLGGGAPEQASLSAAQVGELSRQSIYSEDGLFAMASTSFKDSLMCFIETAIIGRIARLAEMYGGGGEDGGDCDDSIQRAATISKLAQCSQEQLEKFLSICAAKYERAQMEPGTAVGALGAQSIGEPGTQMTLKTFHFAGVASMNVTLGVPRIKEIINAAKNISTPIITAVLVNTGSVPSARIVKGRIEKTLLGDIASSISEVYSSDGCYLAVQLDLEAIRKLHLEVTVYTIATSLSRAPKVRIAEGNIFVEGPDCIRIRIESPTMPSAMAYAAISKKVAAAAASGSMATQLAMGGGLHGVGGDNYVSSYYAMQQVKRQLPGIVIKGIPTVNRAVISDVTGGGKEYNLLVEGYGLRQVMATEGVCGTRTTSNHIMEVQDVLGIEAARQTIANEVQYTMSKHGMTIDNRHVILLADIMTFRGEVLGITRFGIAKMKDSVLMLASFEKTTDHLFDAARFSKQDDIDGVSECIIMGIPMPIGTGLFKIVHRVDQRCAPPPGGKALLFDQSRFFPKAGAASLRATELK